MDSQLPDWMKTRGQRPKAPDKHVPKAAKVMSLAILGVALAGTLVLAVVGAADRAAWFHLTVIAAGAIILVAMFIHPMRGDLRTGATLLLAAVLANYALFQHASHVTENASGIVALAFGILYTGLCALLLLSRSDVRLGIPAKVALAVLLPVLCLTGPLMHLSGLTEGTMGDVAMFFLVLSIPMIPVSLGAFLVLSAARRSEVTLPSDKWL
jgi:hypothetical protein